MISPVQSLPAGSARQVCWAGVSGRSCIGDEFGALSPPFRGGLAASRLRLPKPGWPPLEPDPGHAGEGTDESVAKTSKIVERIKRDALAAARHARFPTSAALVGKNVLVVDDHAMGLARTKAMLSALGGDDMELSTARTASAALDICLSHRGQFDIVILNFLLAPNDNGIELLAMLRRAGLPEAAHALLYSVAMDRKLRKRAMAQQ